MSRSMWGVLAIVLVSLGLGCAGPLTDGKAQFKKGRYAEAKVTLTSVELESRNWDDRKRAEYALYRGLTHGALGDRGTAAIWLSEAKAIEDSHPGTLSADDLARLKLGLESVNPEIYPATP